MPADGSWRLSAGDGILAPVKSRETTVIAPGTGAGEPDRRPHRLHRRACFPIAIDQAIEVAGRRTVASAASRSPATASPRPSSPSTSTTPPASSRSGLATSPASSPRSVPPPGSPAPCAATSLPVPDCRRAPPWRSPSHSRSAPTPPIRSALARLCQAAEHAARGVPTGLLDQLASIYGVAGSGLHLDCRSLEVIAVPLPPPRVANGWSCGPVPVPSATSGYSASVPSWRRQKPTVGPLRDATSPTWMRSKIAVVRARASHVLSENGRVDDFAAAIAGRRPGTAPGRDVGEPRQPQAASSTARRRRSTSCAARCRRTPGVYGARMTGGGWGGCVVALTDPGAVDVVRVRGGVVRPAECRRRASASAMSHRSADGHGVLDGPACGTTADGCRWDAGGAPIERPAQRTEAAPQPVTVCARAEAHGQWPPRRVAAAEKERQLLRHGGVHGSSSCLQSVESVEEQEGRPDSSDT